MRSQQVTTWKMLLSTRDCHQRHDRFPVAIGTNGRDDSDALGFLAKGIMALARTDRLIASDPMDAPKPTPGLLTLLRKIVLECWLFGRTTVRVPNYRAVTRGLYSLIFV